MVYCVFDDNIKANEIDTEKLNINFKHYSECCLKYKVWSKWHSSQNYTPSPEPFATSRKQHPTGDMPTVCVYSEIIHHNTILHPLLFSILTQGISSSSFLKKAKIENWGLLTKIISFLLGNCLDYDEGCYPILNKQLSNIAAFTS